MADVDLKRSNLIGGSRLRPVTDGSETDEAFIAGVVARAGIDGSRSALATAALLLAASTGVTLDERSLRLFSGRPTAAVGPQSLWNDSRATDTAVVGDLPDPITTTLSAPPSPAPVLLGACLEALLSGEQRDAGAHHTPPWVAERVVRLAMEADSAPDGQRTTRTLPGTGPGPGSPGPAAITPEAAPALDRLSVCDPAIGGGVFLLAAADHLHRRGLSRSEVLEHLWGFDTDALAVAVTETVLALWAGVTPPGATSRLVVGDFLDGGVEQVRPSGGWSLIVGNPPFQSQLAGRTARDRDRAERLRRKFGPSAGGYVDEAGLFVLAGIEHLADHGRLALILPASLMAAGDAELLRKAVTAQAPISAVWVPDGQLFPASVDVVVPVFERGPGERSHDSDPNTTNDAGRGRPGALAPHDRSNDGRPNGLPDGAMGVVTLCVGADGDQAASRAVASPGAQWSALLADAEGVPRVHLDADRGLLGDLAEATAGFRQHFYGLADAVSDRDLVVGDRDLAIAARDGEPGGGRPLMTVGLVDPLTSHWGRRPTRLAGAKYDSPVVDPEAIQDADVADWVRDRERPKVLVATQTRVLEAVVDPSGATVPSTPLISVEPHDPGADLWAVAAVLCAPVVTAWFHRRAAGGGLSAGRIRPTARLVRDVPLPGDRSLWLRGAVLVRRASAATDPILRRDLLIEVGEVMTMAYGADSAVTRWWVDILPQP